MVGLRALDGAEVVDLGLWVQELPRSCRKLRTPSSEPDVLSPKP